MIPIQKTLSGLAVIVMLLSDSITARCQTSPQDFIKNIIDKWEAKAGVYLTESVELELSQDFLRTREQFVNSLFDEDKIDSVLIEEIPKYLDDVMKGQQAHYLSFTGRVEKAFNVKGGGSLFYNRYGRLFLETVPKNSIVYIDGKRSGDSSLTFVLKEGTHEVVVKHKGYKDHPMMVKTVAPEKSEYKIEMIKIQ